MHCLLAHLKKALLSSGKVGSNARSVSWKLFKRFKLKRKDTSWRQVAKFDDAWFGSSNSLNRGYVCTFNNDSFFRFGEAGRVFREIQELSVANNIGTKFCSLLWFDAVADHIVCTFEGFPETCVSTTRAAAAAIVYALNLAKESI